MSTGVAMAFVGRADELERLRECASALAAGTGAVVLLEGEAGAGKTRLAEEMRPTVTAGALEYVQAPYGPVRDLLLALDARNPKVRKSDAALNDALRPLFELQPPAAGAPEHRRLLDAVVAALRKYSQAEPLILAFEDVHWIDRGSADVLAHIARDAAEMRILLIITYRGTDAMQREESRALVAQLTRLARIVLPLKPLSAAEAMILINEASSVDLPLPVRRTICELAQGSPLLILELTRHAERDPNALRSGLPVSLQALIHDRVAKFSSAERDVLRVCAALETFAPNAVAEIAGVSAETVLETLRKARAEHIVAESPGGLFVFRHALIRRAISDEVLGIELSALHARIARKLEEQHDGAEVRARLAYHSWMAGDTASAERYNVSAAEDALRVNAFDDAAMLYERAIGDRQLDETTLDLYRKLAGVYESAGRYKQAVVAHRRIAAYARAALTPGEAAQMHVALSRACFHALDDDGSIAAVRDAIAIVGQDGDPATAFELRSLLAWYLVHLRRVEEAQEALEDASRFQHAAQTVPLIRYHEARAAYEVHARGGGDWREHIERSLDLADTLDVADRLRRYTNAMALAVASNLDDFPFAFQLSDRMNAMLDDGVPGESAASLRSTLCWIQYTCGRLDEARRTIEMLLPFMNDTAIYAYRAVSIGVPLALRTGEARLLRACLRPRLLEEAFASKDPVVFGPVAAAVAEHLMVQGRDGEAMALIDRALKRLTDAGNNFDLLLVAGRFGSAAAAKRALELLEPWVERSRSARAVMYLIRAHQSSGKERAALARRAAQGFAELPWPLHQALALELAGDLDEALVLYTQVGAGAEAARLEVRRRRVTALSDHLSKRESEVAELVALGNSNRTIAEQLVLSERTVENHIASIFTKLNVRSRAEIASVVAREKARTV